MTESQTEHHSSGEPGTGTPGEQVGENVRPRSRFLGWAQILLVILIVIGALAFNVLVTAGDNESELEVASESIPVVELFKPVRTSRELTLTETGVVRTRAPVTISPQVSGKIVSVETAMAAGGSFRAGEVLFRIDPTDLQLVLQRAEADLATALSDFELAEAEAETAEREWAMINPGEPVPDLVARKPQIAQARASIASAESAVADAKVNLSRTHFSLPFEGRIPKSSIEMGQTVSAGQSYGEAYALANVEVRLAVDPADLVRLGDTAIGRRAMVRSASSDQATAAEIVRVDAELDPQTRLVGVYLKFSEPGALLPGTFVDATISGRVVEDVFVLPDQSVDRSGQIWTVADGSLKLQNLTVLQRQAEGVVVNAFNSGDGVVLSVPPSPHTGMKVRVPDSASTTTHSSKSADAFMNNEGRINE